LQRVRLEPELLVEFKITHEWAHHATPNRIKNPENAARR
jgi:hypothetical protein